MTQRSDRPAILDEVGAELRRLFLAAQARERSRRRRAPRHWRPLALLAVVVLGGGTVALAAAGVFATGTPVGPSVPAQPNAYEGTAIPGTVHLLSLRVADPAGGPPWALRELRTTRGLECVQLGRVVDGRLGVLGEDGAFGDDGRFHPLSQDAFEFTFNCATLDADGHSFTVEASYGLPASALPGYSVADGGCIRASLLARARTHLRGVTACPLRSQRDVYFGMLGPDATAVSYTAADGRPTATPTAGPDGAFLIVLPHAAGEQGETGGPTLTDEPDNPIRSVAYTGGRRCTLPSWSTLARRIRRASIRYLAELRVRFPALARIETVGVRHVSKAELGLARRQLRSRAYASWQRAHRTPLAGAGSCPAIGYVAASVRRVTSAAVATPIAVHSEITHTGCIYGGSGCGASAHGGGHGVGSRELLVTLTWRTRVAIPNQDSHYEVFVGPTAPVARSGCAGGTGFGPTERDYRAGALVTYTTVMRLACPGVAHGRVVFVQDVGPAGSIPVPEQPGEGPNIPVGSFTVTVP